MRPGIVLASAAAGRWIPDKPILAHGPNSGQFVITNYDAGVEYRITAGSRSGNTITLGTGGTVACDVFARAPKGVSESSSAYAERRTITSYSVHLNIAECGPGPDCSCHPGWGPHWDSHPTLGSVNAHCSRDEWYENAPPAGFTRSFNEWWRVA